jgi:hypothetical protein
MQRNENVNIGLILKKPERKGAKRKAFPSPPDRILLRANVAGTRP